MESRIPKGIVSRLPKWAQEHIQLLESDIDWYKGQLAQINSGESPVSWSEGGIRGEGDHHIPERATVTFALGKHQEIEVELRNGKLSIRRTLGCQLNIRPNAANDIDVFLTE